MKEVEENGYPVKDEWFVGWALPLICLGIVIGAVCMFL